MHGPSHRELCDRPAPFWKEGDNSMKSRVVEGFEWSAALGAAGILMSSRVPVRGAGALVIAAAAGLVALAPTPAAAFVCEDINYGADGAGASPTGMACGTIAQAAGGSSTAVGGRAVSDGDLSTALGDDAWAGGISGPINHNNASTTAIGARAQAGAGGPNQANATALGASAKANAVNATALGTGATANFADSVAVGQGVTTTRANQVAIGNSSATYTLSGINSAASREAQSGPKYLVTSDAAGNLATASVNIDEIEGLADDVAAHTAQIASLNTTVGNHTMQLADHETRIVNNTNQINALNTTVGDHTIQLADHEARITNNTNTLNLHTAQIFSLDSRTTINEANIALLDGRVSALEGGLQNLGEQVSENRSEARAGTALALATAGLRYDDRPGKLSLAGGFGHFKGQSGLALGLGYSTSLDLRLNAAVSASTSRGDVGVSVGASWTLN
ncbi:YadA-like family protein [Mesorhizobium sp. M1365]|uniref:YadA-like family protein n=1 Tax=Mesorhizobium sp. M1365 TaxID=2957090 RepID=UPI0033373ADC